MTKNEFKQLCISRGIKFTGYSGKRKTAFVKADSVPFHNFLAFIGQLNVPFNVMASAKH